MTSPTGECEMAVSGRTQGGLYADHATISEYVATLAEAESMRDQWRRSGHYRRVQIYPWNNGTKAKPRVEYKVLGWIAR